MNSCLRPRATSVFSFTNTLTGFLRDTAAKSFTWKTFNSFWQTCHGNNAWNDSSFNQFTTKASRFKPAFLKGIWRQEFIWLITWIPRLLSNERIYSPLEQILFFLRVVPYKVKGKYIQTELWCTYIFMTWKWSATGKWQIHFKTLIFHFFFLFFFFLPDFSILFVLQPFC